MSLKLFSGSIAVAAIAFVLAASAAHAAVYTSELSFSSAPSTALENFPALVRISTTAPEGFSYEVCPDASHLWFTDAGGTSLPFEVDTWNVDGTSLVWVSVPSLSSAATITMHWADDAANVPNDIPASREVWTRAGYRAVWHFSGSAAESVANLVATVIGSPTYNGNDTYPGPLGKTLWLNGSSYLSFVNNSSWATLGENSTLSISCLARTTLSSPGCDRMISSMADWKDTFGYELTLQSSPAKITVGSSGIGSTGSQFTKDDSSVRLDTAWRYLTATYSVDITKLYVNGGEKGNKKLNPVVAPTGALSIGAEADGDTRWTGGIDEVRIRAAASTAEWIAEEYAVITNEAYVSCSAADATLPFVALPLVTRDANGVFTVTAEISYNAPASVYCVIGGVTNAMSTSDSELPMTYSATLSGLAADTTYECIVAATSTGGSVVPRAGSTALYTGDISVEKVSDAIEAGLVPGFFRISRADTAHNLAVSYSIGGTAVAGQTYVALSGTATIPAGSTFADIEVAPLKDDKIVADVAVVITLAAGLYGIDEGASSAELTVVGIPQNSTLFGYRIPITVSGYTGESTLTDFPVLVTLAADSPSGFTYADCAADGSDIRFLDENDNLLSHEIETWATDGTSYIWVKVPSLAGKNTQFSLYYGTNGISQLPEVRAVDVWSRYAAVFHGGATIADATGKSAAVNANTVTGAAAGGKIGGVMSKATQKATGVQFSNPVKSGVMSSATQASVSGWYKRSNSGNTVITAANVGGWGGGGFLALVEGGTYFSVAVSGAHQGTAGKGALTQNVWGHLAFACDGAYVSSYFNGEGIYSGSKGKTMSDPGETYWGIGSYSVSGTDGFVGDMDEVRFFNGVASADWFKAEYDSVNSPETFAVASAVEFVDHTAQIFNEPSVVRNASGTYVVSVALGKNNGDVGVIYDSGTSAITNIVAIAASPNTYTDTPANLVADTTYAFAAYGKNANGTEVTKKGGVFYNGDLSVETISNAVEDCLVPGVFRISRADTAHDLAVAYTVGGTATPGQTYEALSGTAIIPAGTNSVDIQVRPLLDSATTVDTTVILTLDAGLYGIDAQAGTAELTIVNLVAPSGYNTWIAQSAGLASVGSNWSAGHCPTGSENVLFDGRFSTANCEWDANASATVASWTQRADYTGTVQIDTTYDNTFPALNITDDVAILGGNWTHRINEANDGQKYHLKAIVGGDFMLASGCTITAEKKGYWAQKCPAGSAVSAHAASYDGFDKIYGNVYMPADLGAGSAGAGSASDNKSGGGAVWLEVGGAATLNGTINVRGRQFDGSNTACGSVYVKAKSCTGAGSILANFSATSYYNGSRGSGGRVAIELTEATTLGLPVANVKINGINAGGSGGGGGTFYVKTADPAKPNGTLYLDDQRNKSYGARWHNPQAITAIPAGETWTFDAIVISGYGMLAVPAGTTLNLPNGPMSVSASSTRHGGIRYDGGTINWGSAPYEFPSNWIFQANAPYTFDGDVIVHSGGAIGCLQFKGEADFSNFTKCDITVNGNLTIESGGYLYANGGGPDININRNTVSYHGGQSAGAEGNNAYDSIFAPRLPGYGTANGDQATSAPGGGLLLLSVSGAFVNNGTVTANGASADGAGAAGGSISITAGTLSGAGTFKADSASGSKGSGGGGRIAVRLTKGDFAAGAETNFFARGATVLNSNTNTVRSSSAGTVYLQGRSDAEKGGTIYVRNDKNTLNSNTFTPFPAGVTKGGVAPDGVADFKGASLVVGDCARVKLFDSFKMEALGMESETSLDLNGQTLTVKRAKLGGASLDPGIYTAADAAVAGFVTDSGEGGELVVTGGGFSISIR